MEKSNQKDEEFDISRVRYHQAGCRFCAVPNDNLVKRIQNKIAIFVIFHKSDITEPSAGPGICCSTN